MISIEGFRTSDCAFWPLLLATKLAKFGPKISKLIHKAAVAVLKEAEGGPKICILHDHTYPRWPSVFVFILLISFLEGFCNANHSRPMTSQLQ